VLPKTVWDSRKYKFTHGILAGDILSISGQNGINVKGEIEEKGDFERQARVSLQNMGKILAEAKMGFTDVVMLRSYFTDIGNMTRFTEIMSEFFGNYYPAATAIEVSKLALPELLVEVDAFAVRQRPSR
jgi:enamine deaminase RidA (YjgF/YER057c/UK114 family)